jgi:drug/metabolite transporter (DMT)-like permease
MSGVSMAVGAVVMLALGVVGLVPMHAPRTDVVMASTRVSWIVPVAGIAVIAAATAYVLSIAAARLLGAKLASFVSLTEVLFAVLVAWLALSEQPGWAEALGGVLIVLGVALVRSEELRTVQARAAGLRQAVEPVIETAPS